MRSAARPASAGTTQVAREAPASEGQRTFAVRFDANVAPGLPWRVEPETSEITLRTGETATVFFRFRNLSNRKTSAVAVYNVTPDVAGGWFDKISCFCFSEQHLDPDERAELPVVFFLDPGLEKAHDMDDVHEITLSYTLYAAPDAEGARRSRLQPSAGARRVETLAGAPTLRRRGKDKGNGRRARQAGA